MQRSFRKRPFFLDGQAEARRYGYASFEAFVTSGIMEDPAYADGHAGGLLQIDYRDGRPVFIQALPYESNLAHYREMDRSRRQKKKRNGSHSRSLSSARPTEHLVNGSHAVVATNPLLVPEGNEPLDARNAKTTSAVLQETVDEQRNRLTSECWEFFERNRQDEKTFAQKMLVRDVLYNALIKTFPDWDVVEVGSTLTRCGLDDSALDLCVVVPEHENADCDKKYETALAAVRIVLTESENGMFRQMALLESTRSPILKMKAKLDGRYTEVHLNVNNVGDVYNSYLLYHYAKTDVRLPALCVVVKWWAALAGINDARRYTLSSYALNLMVLHYLLFVCTPPVFPNLLVQHSDIFSLDVPVHNLKLLQEPFPWMDPATTGGTPKNEQSLGELLLGFFDYFADFDFLNQVIAVSGPYPLSRTNLPLVWPSMWPQVHAMPILIVDPYVLDNTARSVSIETLPRIVEAFQAARDALRDSERAPSTHALFESAELCNNIFRV